LTSHIKEKMRAGDGRGGHWENNSDDAESDGNDRRRAFSGPLGLGAPRQFIKNDSRKSARFNLPADRLLANTTNAASDVDDGYVEITLDIRDDSVAVHSVQTATEDPELALLAKRTLEKKSSSSLLRNTSAHIRQVSQELKRFASHSMRSSAARRFDRTKSAATHALKGLKFITTKTGGTAAGWPAIEKRFHDLTASTDGLLPSSLFGECIGTPIPKIYQTI
jgi:respiratory burst oxidase